MRVSYQVAIAALSIGWIAGQASDARAQSSTTGAITGIVRDAAGKEPLSGVTVVATSPNLQGSQAEITDGDGRYRMSSLPPGLYLVTFYYGDIQIQRPAVQVSLTKVTRLDQSVDLTAAQGEVIVVTDKAPTIDVTRTDEGISLDKDYLRHIPVPGRTFGSALGTAAGSQTDSRGTGFSGSTSLENSYVIDGVNTTSLNSGSIGTPLLNEFVEEIQVLTGGYQAEFGRATGAVVNVVTKSGTNEFHGSAFTTITPYQATREPVFQQTSAIDGEFNLDYLADFGVELGGPIVKDKVWFYVGFAPRLYQQNITRIVQRRTDCRATLPDGSLGECMIDPATGIAMNGDGVPDADPKTGLLLFEEIDRDDFKVKQQSYQFVTKLNFAVAPEHQGSVSALGTPTTGNGIFGVFGTADATRADFTSLNTDVSAKWTSKFNDNKTQLEGVLGWHRDKYDQDAIDNSINDIPTTRVFLSTLDRFGAAGGESQRVLQGCEDSGVLGDPYPAIDNCPLQQYWLDSPGFVIDNLEDRKSGQLKLTQRAELAGHHEIKAGIDLESNVTEDVRQLNGGVFYQLVPDVSYRQAVLFRYASAIESPRNTDVCGFEPGDDGFADVTKPRECEYLDSSLVRGNTVNWSAFVQDSWSLRPNLTLNVGLRYEEQRMRYADRIRGTIDPFTDEPIGSNALTLRQLWAPRLGAIYDWTKEGRSKIYASVGRFYESIPMSINDFSFSGDTLYGALYLFDQCDGSDAESQDSAGGAPNPRNCPQGVTPDNPPRQDVFQGGVTLVAPGTGSQYLDEAIVGLQYEAIEDLRLGVSLKTRRLGQVLEDISVDAADTYIIGNPGEFDAEEERRLEREIAGLAADDPLRARLESRLDGFRQLRRFDRPERNYDALELTAVKRFSSRFFLQSSYTLQRTIGNYPGLVDDDTGSGLPNVSTQYDLFELLPNRHGPLPQDRTHNFKFDGYYTWDFDRGGLLTAGMRFRAFSGTPRNALGAHYLYGFSESYLLPRGSFGRTEFVTGTDMHLSYGRRLADGYELNAFVDVFNLFNQEQQFATDDAYTFDNANPIVGGTEADLVFLKRNAPQTGALTNEPVSRNENFQNTSGRFVSQSIRFGLRLSF